MEIKEINDYKIKNDIVLLVEFFKSNNNKYLNEVSFQTIKDLNEIDDKDIFEVKKYFLTFNSIFDDDVFKNENTNDILIRIFERGKKQGGYQGYINIFFHFD